MSIQGKYSSLQAFYPRFLTATFTSSSFKNKIYATTNDGADHDTEECT
jgi:hypothetical protein